MSLIEKVEVYRVEDRDGRVMYLSKLDDSLRSLKDALHHLELMPDSITTELRGLDGSRVIFTKTDIIQLNEEMKALAQEKADD